MQLSSILLVATLSQVAARSGFHYSTEVKLAELTQQLDELKEMVADQEAHQEWGAAIDWTKKAVKTVGKTVGKVAKKGIGFFKQHKCTIVDGACKGVLPVAVGSVVECTAADALLATACEVVGLGPEDPAADACAATLGIGFEAACVAAVKVGGHFGAAECAKIAKC